MWIVRVALNRPYTFVVLALLVFLLSPVVISKTPTDIFPNVDIPVVSVAWSYTGLNAEELSGRLTTPYQRAITTLVDNIEHLESTTVNGWSIVKIFLQPGASLDTANAQVGSASQWTLRFMPAGVLPPEIINYSASSVPVLQLGVSGNGLSEQELNDLSFNFLRTQLITVPGAVVPLPYGGKQRQVNINLDPRLLQSKGLAPQDVLNAVALQTPILPSGGAKIGQFEYDVRLRASPQTADAYNDLPIRLSGGAPIYVRDVAHVSDGFAPQTNIVRQDGHRGVLMSVLKAGSASTLTVVNGIRQILPRAAQILPPQLVTQPLADQSVFVRAAIGSVLREALIAACLTALMIWLFIGSWRSTVIIAVSIPLSILTSILILSALHETINIMTLGGLALAVGILVDDATVEVENINRNLAMGKALLPAILDGAQQIAVPAFVSTLAICVVFLPMFFLGGVARYLFVPLAEAVVFAMLASYFWSRTIVPTLAKYLLTSETTDPAPSRNPLTRLQHAFERGFQRVSGGYASVLGAAVHRRAVFIPAFLALCLSAALLVPFVGQDFFPSTDSGQFILHVRAKTGTRIEETARLCDGVEALIRRAIPARETDHILDNIGLPGSPMNFMHSTSGAIGAGDADIMVSLTPGHRPTADYVRDLRAALPRAFPGVVFYFLPADIVTQVLNFGTPAAIDVQIEGSDLRGNRQVAETILAQLRHVPGLVDAHIHQAFDYPNLDVEVDRTKAIQSGFTEREVANSLLNSLSGSFQTAPLFFLNPQNGISYNMVAKTAQYRVQSLQDLENTPIGAAAGSRPAILANVASITRSAGLAVVNDYNIRRVVDIYGSVQDRDLGAVGRDITRVVDASRRLLPRGSFLNVRGQLQTMQTSYRGSLIGLGFAIVLVYLLIVVNFQSWLDPLIIISALPAALAGIVLCLFVTHTTLSVPALMGTIMCMGVVTANSILVVSFAKERLVEHGDPVAAAIDAGVTRFRPVLMTALAMIIGMVPMALSLGEGGEQNAPLGRAVIGGLVCATAATLVFVPAVFSLLHVKRPAGEGR
ncbi:MAG: acriflavin resistance protein [Acidobacteria bacterium]|nr:acriflavin resistance protein [Acidobacteriota bacterium]